MRIIFLILAFLAGILLDTSGWVSRPLAAHYHGGLFTPGLLAVALVIGFTIENFAQRSGFEWNLHDNLKDAWDGIWNSSGLSLAASFAGVVIVAGIVLASRYWSTIKPVVSDAVTTAAPVAILVAAALITCIAGIMVQARQGRRAYA